MLSHSDVINHKVQSCATIMHHSTDIDDKLGARVGANWLVRSRAQTNYQHCMCIMTSTVTPFGRRSMHVSWSSQPTVLRSSYLFIYVDCMSVHFTKIHTKLREQTQEIESQ